MFELKDLILVVDDILTTEECDTLVKHFEDRKAHSYAEESRNVHTNKSEVTIDKVLQLVPNYAPELFGNHFNIAAEATDKIISKYQNYIEVLRTINEYSNNYGHGVKENNFYDWLMIIPINTSVATNGFFAGIETKSNAAVVRAYKVVLDQMLHETVEKLDLLQPTND